MRKLLNSLPGRLVCGAAVLFMVAGLFAEPWNKLAHATVFAVLTALLALALQGRLPDARWALRPGAALAVAALLADADAVGMGLGLWVARGCWR